ncbi:DUF4142 domain-containing protein [Nocardia transvalensis]|uniref:DUF4142 domain-containing protein n=1 Tax=Nocardia transvalensis TaxID=37333 RepID=UPI001893B6BE|nr:DUF4142 domain-containing protein [Nocardia transvalensis]MBF6328312.1 DUF4142 domain-containing protein [Nocardia transvalensis]
MRSLQRGALAAAAAIALTTAIGSSASAEPAALSNQDRTYLVVSHQGHLSEMLSGTRAALSPQGVCQDVRQIGQMLVVDHARLDAMGGAVAVMNGVVPPLTPNPDQIQQLLSTGMKTGRDFDRSWLQMQQRFHSEALAAGRQQIAAGSSEQVKMLARDAEPIITHHLEMVNNALTRC